MEMASVEPVDIAVDSEVVVVVVEPTDYIQGK